MLKYLGTRNVGIFSTDMDSFDFKMRHPQQVVKSVMAKLKKHGKGIILMHDFQHATSEAVAELFKQMKAEIGGGLEAARPMSSVIKTISGPTAN